MGRKLDPVKTLLGDLAKDDYVRFKYGKRVDAAVKLLDQADLGPDAAAIEARLVELLDVVRGGKPKAKKGAGATAPDGKSAGHRPRAKGTKDAAP